MPGPKESSGAGPIICTLLASGANPTEPELTASGPSGTPVAASLTEAWGEPGDIDPGGSIERSPSGATSPAGAGVDMGTP